MRAVVRVDQPDGVLVDARRGSSGSSQRAMTPNADDAGDQQRSARRRQPARRAPAARRRRLAGARSAAAGRSSAGSWARIASCRRAQLGAGLDADLLDQRRRARRGRPPAPRPGGRSDTARACAARAAARAADARRRAPRARRSPRRGGRPPGRRRSPARWRAGAARSSRRISAAANGSSATSASASPRHSASASRGATVLEQALGQHARRPSPSAAAAAHSRARGSRSARRSPSSSRRSCETYSCTILAALGGGSLAPQPLDQPVGRDRPTGLQREHRQHRPLLGSAERQRSGRRARASTGPSRRRSIASGGIGARSDDPTPSRRGRKPVLDRVYTDAAQRSAALIRTARKEPRMTLLEPHYPLAGRRRGRLRARRAGGLRATARTASTPPTRTNAVDEPAGRRPAGRRRIRLGLCRDRRRRRRRAGVARVARRFRLRLPSSRAPHRLAKSLRCV